MKWLKSRDCPGKYSNLFLKDRGQFAFAHDVLWWRGGAINVHHEKSAIFMLANRRPHDVTICPRNILLLNFAQRDPLQPPLVEFILRNKRGVNQTSCLEQENQPVHLALIALLAHHSHATHIVTRERDAGLLGNFSDGAFMRTLALADFKFATNGAAHSNVGLLLAMQQKDAPLLVPQVA